MENISSGTPSQPVALVVEDDEKLSMIYTQALRLAGYEARAIADGQVAWQWLEQAAPALILLDLHLPGVSGGRLLEHIRRQPHLAKAQVILATADAMMAGTLQDRCTLVLLKPISFTQLKELAARIRNSM